MAFISRGTPFTLTASGTAVAIATKNGVTGATYYVTDITASCPSTSGTLVVYTGTTAGTNAIWQTTIGTNVTYTDDFQTPVTGALGGSIQIVVNGTVATYVNLSGYQIGPF